MFDVQRKTTKHAKKQDTWDGKQNSGRVFAQHPLGLGFKPQLHHLRNCNHKRTIDQLKSNQNSLKKKSTRISRQDIKCAFLKY